MQWSMAQEWKNRCGWGGGLFHIPAFMPGLSTINVGTERSAMALGFISPGP
jgi:hypothetical protein